MKKISLIMILSISCFTCDDIVGVGDISDKIVKIVAPTNHSIINTKIVVFTWNALDNTENYSLQVATPTFENASQIMLDTLITNTNYIKTLDAANYEWRIRAENSGYHTNYTTNSFIVEE